MIFATAVALYLLPPNNTPQLLIRVEATVITNNLKMLFMFIK